MIVYVLIFLLFSGDQAQPVPGVYPDKFNCEVAYGDMVTLMQKDPKVKGWVTIGEPCAAVSEAKKV